VKEPAEKDIELRRESIEEGEDAEVEEEEESLRANTFLKENPLRRGSLQEMLSKFTTPSCAVIVSGLGVRVNIFLMAAPSYFTLLLGGCWATAGATRA